VNTSNTQELIRQLANTDYLSQHRAIISLADIASRDAVSAIDMAIDNDPNLIRVIADARNKGWALNYLSYKLATSISNDRNIAGMCCDSLQSVIGTKTYVEEMLAKPDTKAIPEHVEFVKQAEIAANYVGNRLVNAISARDERISILCLLTIAYFGRFALPPLDRVMDEYKYHLKGEMSILSDIFDALTAVGAPACSIIIKYLPRGSKLSYSPEFVSLQHWSIDALGTIKCKDALLVLREIAGRFSNYQADVKEAARRAIRDIERS